MAQFYTLEEAARALGMNSEELKQKAQRREVRAFLDSGSWRFRTSDIDELARRRGMGSDPDLSLSDIDLLPDQTGEGSFDDQSVFQLGVARSDLGPASMEELPAEGSGSDADILLDDASLPIGSGSSSHIIGMEPGGKLPSDSDVRLVPEGPKGASDSDVQLSGEVESVAFPIPPAPTPRPTPGDSDVTLVQEGDESFEGFGTMDFEESSSAFSANLGLDSSSGVDLGGGGGSGSGSGSGSGETTLRGGPLGSDDDFRAEVEVGSSDEEDSDFELTPSSVIDALQPESGSDFELTALDGSDEFEASAPRPSDSDVTGAEPSTSGVNLGKPSDSGINLQALGSLNDADSIELAPLEADSGTRPPAAAKPKAAKPATNRPDPSATAMPGIGAASGPGSDPSATALPVREQGQKDIFEDTDFEVDALDSGEDQTMQLDANSDFDLDESESASEVFALDEEDVDQNAATAMGPAVLEDEDALGAAMDVGSAASDEMEQVGWDEEVAPSSSSAAVAATPSAASRRGATGGSLLTDAGGPPWGGIWVGMLGVTGVLMMLLAFITMDVVRNLNSYQSDTPVASGLVKMIAGGE